MWTLLALCRTSLGSVLRVLLGRRTRLACLLAYRWQVAIPAYPLGTAGRLHRIIESGSRRTHLGRYRRNRGHEGSLDCLLRIA